MRNLNLDFRYKLLSSSTADVCMDICEYASEPTPGACYRLLEEWKERNRITKATYDEIAANVTFYDMLDED